MGQSILLVITGDSTDGLAEKGQPTGQEYEDGEEFHIESGNADGAVVLSVSSM
jgi:hypothetical protein